MDNNKENLAVLNMFDEGYLSCTEIFCDNLDNSSSKSVPAAVQPNNNNNAQHELHNLGKSLPKLLQVKAQVDRTLVADDRVLANMIRHETRYLPSNPDYFRYVQPEIRPHMRKIVSDWMLEVCQELACQPEVFCLAMNLMDRFLARCRISKSQLQLLGAVCLFLSSKFKETAPIPSEKLVMYTDFSVSLEEIREWELVVLHKLKWDLCSSTALDYLDHILPKLIIDPVVDQTVLRRQTETIIALASTHYLFSYVRPSVIASSAIAVALRCIMPSFSAEGARTFLAGLQAFSRAEACDLEACSTAMIQTLPAYLTTTTTATLVRSTSTPSTGSSNGEPTSTAVTPSPPVTPPNQTAAAAAGSDSFFGHQSSVLVKSC